METSKAEAWHVEITPKALQMIRDIPDRRIQRQIADRIDGLARDPDKQGKPLLGVLSGVRSLRAASQRYRILYKIEGPRIVVLVVAVGIRKKGDRGDIYELAKKLIRKGLF